MTESSLKGQTFRSIKNYTEKSQRRGRKKKIERERRMGEFARLMKFKLMLHVAVGLRVEKLQLGLKL